MSFVGVSRLVKFLFRLYADFFRSHVRRLHSRCVRPVRFLLLLLGFTESIEIICNSFDRLLNLSFDFFLAF